MNKKDMQKQIDYLSNACIYVLKNSLEESHKEFFRVNLAELVGILKALYYCKKLDCFDLTSVKEILDWGDLSKVLYGELGNLYEILFENSLK
jgi:hypothetical protein